VERLHILQLKAMRGWTTAKTAEVFLLNELTISSWFERIDEEGENALLQVPEPVNKFPVQLSIEFRGPSKAAFSGVIFSL